MDVKEKRAVASRIGDEVYSILIDVDGIDCDLASQIASDVEDLVRAGLRESK